VLGTNIDAARLRQGVDFAADATVLTIGIPVAYVTALIVGVPAFFILRTIGRLGLMGCLATGAIAGILPVRLLLLRTTDASTYAIGAGLGLCSACVFWAVGVRRRRAANAVDEQPE
jgi:hypothetical protein